jgi:predicted protein tyrosine phosphatase
MLLKDARTFSATSFRRASNASFYPLPYFDDVLEGVEGAATVADIETLLDFAQIWLLEVCKNPSAQTIVHCAAGVSRSAASALLLLVLYFEDYLTAATHLFRVAPRVVPNAWICRLIFEKFGPAYGSDILEALAKGKEAGSHTA